MVQASYSPLSAQTRSTLLSKLGSNSVWYSFQRRSFNQRIVRLAPLCSCRLLAQLDSAPVDLAR